MDPPRARSKTALIIEDNEDNMELLAFLLRHDGYRVAQAWTGAEGLRMARELAPDVILLDIGLPDTDGLEVLAEMRSSEHGKDLPIIAVTSFAMTGDRERLLAAGCTGYIEKPIDPERVLQQIRDHLPETR